MVGQRGSLRRVTRDKRVMRGAAVVAAALVLSACSSSGGSSSATSGSQSAAAATSPSAAATSPAASGSSAAGSSLITKYEAQPTFTAPGPSFDAKKAAGKTVWVIPTTSQVSVVPAVEAAMKTALATAGVKTQLVTTAGEVSQWVQGMSSAVAQKANAIVLLGIDPTLIAPQIAAAAAAKIPVIYTFSYDGQPIAKNVSAVAAINYPTIAKVLIQKALADTNNNAHILVIKAPELAPQTLMTQTMTSELAADCSSCKIEQVLEEPIANWSTNILGDTRTALLANPNINVIIPLSDSMNEWVIPAVSAANATSRIKIETVDATPSTVQQIGKTPLSGDMGYSNAWVGWASADQALRLMTGNAPAADENIPSVLFDASNVAKATGDLSTYYGNSFVAGYEGLWGTS
jgi:ribose transport system substrate-binding protein